MGSQIKTQQKVMGHKWSSNADDGWWNTDAAMSALETRMQCSDRYGGAWPFRHR